MKETTIALIQIAAEIGRHGENGRKIRSYIRNAADAGAKLAVFPECSLTGYCTEGAVQAALAVDDGEIKAIREAADASGIAVCFGYIEKSGDGLFITQELHNSGQHIFYRKTHLGSKEKQVFSEGNSFFVLPAPVICGMQLCWESHIPEISSLLRGMGAELLLVPYARPMGGEAGIKSWDIHFPARASDNGAYLAACNLLFPEDHSETGFKGGGLAVYDPKGRRIASFNSAEEHMLLCELTGPLPRELPEGDMHNISYFDRKRPELY